MKSDRLKRPLNEDTAMSANAHDIKRALHALADQLPEDATWKDVVYEIYVRQEIEAGLKDIEEGRFKTVEEVRAEYELENE
ncbi:MAG: hypothetical protein BMS9Abin06_0772 [Gammaproteobacteria bacterium]|nr:MAG: hypothetical protein BMS9Abin06_0772 [Gammaproteobacteria bacterium]